MSGFEEETVSRSDKHQICSSRVPWVTKWGSICKEIRSSSWLHCELNSFSQRLGKETSRAKKGRLCTIPETVLQFTMPVRKLFRTYASTLRVYGISKVLRRGCVRPLSLFYSDASADGVEERSLVPRSRSYARLRRNATMSHAFSCVQTAFIDL
ncbi:hypothetical protein EVAR_2934_1 [Eumeta japonica]|uniref:Uncharacterized protein n=1 Tax=Eumeta variegata TaxID=151549 RepID=A0A4C1T1R1_EUMVA|nr:hypothetical protein EVAR_2934_1 [Eumeta japonica]